MKCKIMLMTHGKLAESLSATAELICGEKVAFKNMPEARTLSFHSQQTLSARLSDLLSADRSASALWLPPL